MDFVAGDAPEILLVIGLDDLAALDDRRRFAGHLSLGSGLDPTWLDLFSEAVRATTGGDDPSDFIDARLEINGPEADVACTVERIDRAWVDAVAQIAERDVSAIAARWIELVEEELGHLPREEKPWIRELAGKIVAFCQAADRAPDVLFAWSLR
jgi:hypothetical protein